MNEQEILELITAELAKLSDEDAGPITRETRLREDLGLNSLDAVDLALELEDELDVEVPDEQLATFQRVGDVVDAIQSLLAERVATES